jgi:hypothetical protein
MPSQCPLEQIINTFCETELELSKVQQPVQRELLSPSIHPTSGSMADLKTTPSPEIQEGYEDEITLNREVDWTKEEEIKAKRKSVHPVSPCAMRPVLIVSAVQARPYDHAHPDSRILLPS